MNQAEKPKFPQSDREDEAEQLSSLSAEAPNKELDNSQLEAVVGGSSDSNPYPVNPQAEIESPGQRNYK